MRKVTLFVAIVLTAASLGFTRRESELEEFSLLPRILAFDTMYGVDGPFVGDTNPIRGIVGDEAPWVIARFARGSLTEDGHLRLRVRGLVFANDPRAPAGFVGKNDEPDFRGAVSCLTEDAQGNVSTANVITAGFPATMQGDSNIEATLVLPQPCVAPIVFVLAGSEDKWFAVTGIEDASTSHRHSGEDSRH